MMITFTVPEENERTVTAMAEYVTKAQVIDWFSPYGHLDKPIPFETLVSDLRGMKAADVEPVQQWIPVTERLPETCVAVLARCFYHGKWRTLVCHTSKRNDGEWYTNEIGQWVPVTHWMPLPQPPKGGNT